LYAFVISGRFSAYYFQGDYMQNFIEYEAPARSRRDASDTAEGGGKAYFMGRVILVQLIVFTLLAFVLFFICRAGGEGENGLRQMYRNLFVKDYTVSQMFSKAKEAMSFVLTPQKTEENEAEEPSEISDEADELDGAGGEDLISPRDNASFSPFYLSMPIFKPVNSDRITSRFGYRINPVTNEYGFHSGLDLAAPEGTEIYAAFDGIVEKADCSAARGNYIFLNSEGNIKTVYCHCSELLVNEGDTVKAGQLIAKVGSTGQATGPHLHFEIRINGIYYNPEWVISCNGD